MLETVAAGLILAAVSGLTYIAYRHPQAYRRIVFPLVWLVVAIQILLSIWYVAVMLTHAQLLRVIEPSKFDEARSIASSMTPRWWVISIVCASTFLYLGVLSILPVLLHEKKEPEPDHESPKEKD